MSIHAINAKNLALSDYTGLSLIALTEHDGSLYGVTATQLLEFTGSADGSTDIDAYIETGKMDFGSDELKRFTRLYVGGSGDEGMTVTVTTDESGSEQAREYPEPSWSGSLRERRVKLARGAKSRHAQVKIANSSGGSFKLESLGLLVKSLPRRV